MATTILRTAGQAIAGPVGAFAGALAGGAVDGALFGRRPAAAVPPQITSSAYGEPLPRIHGTMRTGGQLIWATPMRESGRGKGTTSRGYVSSFAVLLSARRIVGVGRVWADGELARDGGGQWRQPVTMRVHTGLTDQAPDPLIVAVEGLARAPAYRGRAYAVFEELDLAAFGNRIPSLSFEVQADVEGVMESEVIVDVAGAVVVSAVGGEPTGLAGFAVTGGSAASALSDFALSVRKVLCEHAGRLRLVAAEDPVATIPREDLIDDRSGGTTTMARRGAGLEAPAATTVGFSDIGRDYLPGLQRAWSARRAGATDHRELPVALVASAAKGLARAFLVDASAARERFSIRVTWRWLGLRVGDRVRVEGDPNRWRIVELVLDGPAITIDLQRDTVHDAISTPADPGRSMPNEIVPHGPTRLHVLDLPVLDKAVPVPRVWLAVSGELPGWRQAQIAVHQGDNRLPIATTGRASRLGDAKSVLQAAPCGVWDLAAWVEVELAGTDMWLESASDDAVLGGANFAALGGELFAFGKAQALGSRRFRLSRLLRGLRGTELATTGHAIGDAFTLIELDRLVPFEPGLETIGRSLALSAIGPGEIDDDARLVSTAFSAAAAKPPCPVHLACGSQGPNSVRFSWIRRDRSGSAWLDEVETPLSESRQSYRVALFRGSVLVASDEIAETWWDWQRDAPGLVTFRVRQVGAVGLSDAAEHLFTV